MKQSINNKKIVISAAYGMGNLGDEAICETIIYDSVSVDSATRITVLVIDKYLFFTSHPDFVGRKNIRIRSMDFRRGTLFNPMKVIDVFMGMVAIVFCDVFIWGGGNLIRNKKYWLNIYIKPFAGKFIVGISPFAGNKIKEWPVDRFADIANYATEKYGAVIVIIGGKNDNGYAEDMKRRLSKKTVFLDVVGMLSIDELKAVIARLNVFISVDTGPIYIAEAFGVPTIDIVGPMDEREQPPIGKFHKVVVAPRKTAQLHIMSARLYDKKEARRQVESITSVMVCAEIDALLQELKIVVG